MTDPLVRAMRADLVRQGDQLLLEALWAAGWRQADANKRDAVTAYLTERGWDLWPVDHYDAALLQRLLDDVQQ